MKPELDNANITTNLPEAEQQLDAFTQVNAQGAPPAPPRNRLGTLSGAAGGPQMEPTRAQIDSRIHLAIKAADLGQAAGAILSACKEVIPDFGHDLAIKLLPNGDFSALYLWVELQPDHKRKNESRKTDIQEAGRIMVALCNRLIAKGYEIVSQ